MNRYVGLFVLVFAAASLQASHADIVVSFVESAPKDRFVVENRGACPFDDLIVEIDLSEIDVDDQLPQSELGMIRVTGSEMENSLASITFWEEQLFTAVFNANSVAVVPSPACQA